VSRARSQPWTPIRLATAGLAALLLVTAGLLGDTPRASGGRDERDRRHERDRRDEHDRRHERDRRDRDRSERRLDGSRRTQLRFMWAMAGQESGWDYYARNRASGAYGKYQIMPSNWPSWAGLYLGNRQADQTPWNQERVAYARQRDLYRSLKSWDRVAYWWLTGSNERYRKRWSAYAAGYVDSIMRLLRRAPHDGGPMPRRTWSRVGRGDWRVVHGRQVLRLEAMGRAWRRGGGIRSGEIVQVRKREVVRTGVIWLRVVTRDGRLGWLRQILTMPARAPDRRRLWRDIKQRTDGPRDDRRHIRPRPSSRPEASRPYHQEMIQPSDRPLMDVRPVPLEGRLVRLEPLTDRHVEGLVAAADPSVWRWTVEANGTPELVRAHLERAIATAKDGTQVVFATVERSSDTAVGCTRFLSIDRVNRHVEIGWTWVTPRLQGHGYNDEAKLLQLTHAFETLGCHRVEFKTDSLNERSRGALAAIGATFEGIFRNHMIMPDGRLRHSAWYSVTADEWPSVKARLQGRLEARIEDHLGRRG
jgi:N-acetyltransferase